MSYSHAVRILYCGFLLFAVPLPASQAPGASPQKTKVGGVAAARRRTDVCILLTGEEIEAIQGEAVKETRPNVRSSDGMLLSECLFRTETSAKSVSVALVMPNPAGPSALTPRKFWQKQFHSPELEEEELAAAGKAAKRPEPEGEKEGSKPRLIDGLGEEAYWVGNPIMGALYVLHGDTFLRISVGGVREESRRIENSKALARAVVKRL
jgi:hypothetical protein